MSLESLYQKYAGTADTSASAEKWPYGPSPEPPQGQPATRMVVGGGPSGPDGPEPMQEQAVKPLAATAQEVEAMLNSLHAVGHNLGEVEPLARTALLELSRAAAAELTAVLDDLFQTAQSADVARSQCQRVLSDPQMLDAARACWPDLAILPDANASFAATQAPVVDHAPQWLRLIREHCPLVTEDTKLLTRCLAMQPSRDALQAAQRYVATWQHAADAEPTLHRKANAGRRAANNELRGGSRHAG